MGSCIKVWIAYRTAFWREKGLNGFAALEHHPFNPFWDASPPDQSIGLLVGFFDAAPADEWRTRSVDARREAVLAAIVDALGPAGHDPIDYVEQDWHEERWSRGNSDTSGCVGAPLVPKDSKSKHKKSTSGYSQSPN